MKQVYNSGKIIVAKQDGLREFISLFASICTDSTKIPLALIYKEVSRDLQDSWLDDLKKRKYTWFISSINKQLSNILNIVYFTQVFNSATYIKAGYRKRLLIIDRYSSYINIEFI